MKKSLLTLILLTLLFAGCSKKNDETPALSLSGTHWYGIGEKHMNGLTYYKQFHFTSDSEADMYTSYLIGESTDVYTGKLKYKINTPSGTTPTIIVTGKDGFGRNVDFSFVYDRKSITLMTGAESYTKFK
ncbi:hypothetical protein ABDJ41_12025 [Pedobacter sp. ASV1-7]|uniref:hypothetical protein n=1 Tax=Pedobacter sp. ASV1-7 TaxID=3145237 RepID=UPI0032E88AE8